MIVVAADYAGKLSPKYVASLQGIVFAAHYCFGKQCFGLLLLLIYCLVMYVQYFINDGIMTHSRLAGKGGGSLIGGQIYSHYGSRVAFRWFAVA